MMARAKMAASPEERIEELREERVRLAGERDGLEVEARKANMAQRAIPARRQAALVDAARGRRGESVEEIDRDAGRLQALVADHELRVQALLKADREIARDQGDVFESDEGLAFYEGRANTASLEAVAAREHAESVIAEAAAAWGEAERQWLSLRQARIHRGEDVPQHVPSPAFNPLMDLRLAHCSPWPGGTRPDSEGTDAA